ncbi:MAG: DUF1499 domain-containing protein [Balneolaceae bacterium]|nr:DUF1499 domain-containing protein [Balneolaceae bacterium]
MANPFFLSGSTPDDFEQPDNRRNLLPPCPDSPNCVRLNRSFNYEPDATLHAAKSVLEDMGAIKMNMLEDPLRISCVFRAFIFKDDFNLLIDPLDDDNSCVVHIRSASRVGHSDLGMNRRRVKRFLRKLETELEE